MLVRVDDVIKAVGTASSKQCASYRLPTWLLKDSSATHAPFITTLFNTSLADDYFPKQQMSEIDKPLIKKAGLDEPSTSNYQLVSNLPFLSKVLERIIHQHMTCHLNKHNLLRTSNQLIENDSSPKQLF